MSRCRKTWNGSNFPRPTLCYWILRSGPAGTGTYFLHNDHLGRPLAMSNTTAQLVWRGEYEPFGRSLAPRTNTLNIGPGFRFPGQWEPSDSGDVPGGKTGSLGSINALIDNWHRTYVPRWGRYSQPDPIGLGANAQSLAFIQADPKVFTPREQNLFVYASGNPLGGVDPLGLATITNKSCSPIYVKPENGSASQLLMPGSSAEGDGFYNVTFDSCEGFCGRGGPKPEVYKINNVTDVTISGGCGKCLGFSYSGPISAISNWLDPRSGWQSGSFFAKHPDWPKPPMPPIPCCTSAWP